MFLWHLFLALISFAAANKAPQVSGETELVKIGDGQCNGGVGGSGEHKCLIGGTCNEGGQPLADPTSDGTGCPGASEYLLCTEDSSITLETCKSACESDTKCVGFLLSYHAAKGKARCELHTKTIEFAAEPLECYTYDGSAFTLIGKGACRTKALTVGGPQNGTHYGNMAVAWVASLTECEQACRGRSESCVGVEYHATASTDGSYKCEIHFEELAADQMSLFECWTTPTCRNSFTCSDGYAQDAKSTPCSGTSCSSALCCGVGLPDMSVDGANRAHWRSLIWLLPLCWLCSAL